MRDRVVKLSRQHHEKFAYRHIDREIAEVRRDCAERLRALEDENRRLKEMVADLSLDREVLKGVIRKNGWSL